MVKLSCSDVDASNIVRPTLDQLSAEDRQAYEVFIKECEEENTRRKEKEIEEKHQWRSISGSCLTSPGTGRVKS